MKLKRVSQCNPDDIEDSQNCRKDILNYLLSLGDAYPPDVILSALNITFCQLLVIMEKDAEIEKVALEASAMIYQNVHLAKKDVDAQETK